MKKTLLTLVGAFAILSLVSTGWAAMIKGNLVKIDDKTSMYVVKDAKGKEHKIHFDDTTKKTGEIKVGVDVEVDDAKGHAKSITVVEMKK